MDLDGSGVVNGLIFINGAALALEIIEIRKINKKLLIRFKLNVLNIFKSNIEFIFF
ncbi:MAG: hypothetical protein ACJAZX_000003 [Rickettsiales bacterium]